MKKVAPGIQRSVYPLDYNKNNPSNDQDFNNWQLYIHNTLIETCTGVEMTLVEAKKILNKQLVIK